MSSDEEDAPTCVKIKIDKANIIKRLNFQK
jgi:hypothetical protein